jgi:hypothetical protein
MSVTGPTMFTTNLLIADSNYTLSGTQEVLVKPTTVACGIELQSTSTALCISRLTGAEIAALAAAGTATNGMLAYNTTTNAFNYYVNGSWTASSGAGTITTPGVTTVNAVVLWGNTVGTQLLNSTVLISALGAITGVLDIDSASGLVGDPSYAFTASTSTGMWSSAANTVDFSTNGLEALQILPVASAVNWLAISPSATNTPVLLSALGTDTNIGIRLIPQGTGGVVVPVGTATHPGVVFTGSLTTGMFSSAANTVDFATNGLEALQILPVALAVNWLAVSPSATTTPVLLSALGTDTNIGIQLVTKGTGSVIVPNGAVATPSIVFTGSPTTGMFRSAANTIDFSTNGLEALQILPVVAAVNWLAVSPSATTTPVLLSALGTDGNIGIEFVTKGTGGVIHPVGAVGTPGITFVGDLTSGLYHVGAGVIGASILGTAVGQWSAKGISIGQTANTDATPPTNTIFIANGTPPAGSAPADSIEIYSTDAVSNAATVTTLGLAGEGSPAVAIAITAGNLTRSMPIVVNGVTYYIPLSLVQS